MDRQAAYELFTTFLRKRDIKGVDLDKDLPALLAHALSYGFFSDPHSVHDLAEWRRYGDRLWDLVLDDDKPAKKMSKFWKVVQNALLMVQAEKRAAESARLAQARNRDYDPSAPNPPMFASVEIPERPPPAPPFPAAPPPAPPFPDNPAASPSAPPFSYNPAVPAPVPPSALSGLPPVLPSAVPVPLGPPPPPSNATEPFPGALSDIAEAMAKKRREAWAALAKQGINDGDLDLAAAAQEQVPAMSLAFPVIFHQRQGAPPRADVTQLDWKLLAQLRATVAQFGVTSEPAKQMLDYLFNSTVLLPGDIKGIARLIYTPHQKILFEARWKEEAAASVALPRPAGDPLQGITLDELMGDGNHIPLEQQAALGPEKLREAMTVAKRAMDKVRDPGGLPIYMGIKQGREEPLGAFVDKIMTALSKAGVADHMRDAILKQCVIQNGNSSTRSLISTAPGDWTVRDLLDKAAALPAGSQVFMIQALEKIGEKISEGLNNQAQAQQQVLAALAPLQAPAVQRRPAPTGARMKYFRCGRTEHIRRECTATQGDNGLVSS